MSDFVVSIDGDLRVMALRDIPADTDFANIVGEVVGDADTDDPLVALRNPLHPSPCVSYRDFVWVDMFGGGGQVRLSKMRGET